MEILHHFEQTALRLCEGQHLDMTFERLSDVSVQSYLRMIGGKTAALIGAAAWIGAYAAGAQLTQAEAAGRFGRELGLAFQMQDDILGLWGDEAVTGKSAVSDVASRKKTLPVLLALEHAVPERRQRLRDLYAQPGDDAATIAEIMAILDGAQARTRAREYMQRHWQAAMTALAEIGLSAAAHERLSQFAHQFVDRSA
jgi:geranylgeranyl diphosphate synthase type I